MLARETSPTNPVYEECDTVFYQGMNSSQTQALKYTGTQRIVATTGQMMWCTGRNNLAPLNVIYNLHIGTEIADVNLQPFDSYFSVLNPIKVFGSGMTWLSNWRNGFQFSPAVNPSPESVVFHAPNLSQVSIGQEPDINSHKQKYLSWLAKEDRKNGLILWGVSRGTAATFSAFANEHYPEVRLVVLEGAIDSVDNVISKRVKNTLKYDALSNKVNHLLTNTFTFFNQKNILSYKHGGQSPLSSVEKFPENIPVVFITSKTDKEVPSENTENIAMALTAKGKNDVYLLKLERSSHPNYMFDDKSDRDRYESFIHAIYKKYGLQHDSTLAEKSEIYLDDAKLINPADTQIERFSF